MRKRKNLLLLRGHRRRKCLLAAHPAHFHVRRSLATIRATLLENSVVFHAERKEGDRLVVRVELRLKLSVGESAVDPAQRVASGRPSNYETVLRSVQKNNRKSTVAFIMITLSAC